MASRGISWHLVASRGISWHLVASRGILWHPVASRGISWHLRHPVAFVASCGAARETDVNNDGIQGFTTHITCMTRRSSLVAGWLYVVQYPGLAENNIHMYKVGRTSNLKKRLDGYPAGTILLFQVSTSNMRRAEKAMLDALRRSPDMRVAPGMESFYGPLDVVVAALNDAARLFPPTDRTVLPPRDACDWFLESHPDVSLSDQRSADRNLELLHQFLVRHECITLVSKAEMMAHDGAALRNVGASSSDLTARSQRGACTDLLTGPSVARMMARVLCPGLERAASDTWNTVERRDINKVPLIRELIAALGMRSPFDDETTVPDLMATFELALMHTALFRDYNTHVRLFRGGIDVGVKGGWDLKKVSKAINMVLGDVGLKLVPTTVSRPGRAAARKRTSSNYRLEPGHVLEMIELVKPVLIESGQTPVMEHARSRLNSIS